MSRRFAVSCLVLGLFGAPALAQLPITRDEMPTRTSLARLGLEKQWSTIVPLGGANERLARINVDDGQLFVQTTLGHVHAYDAESGRYLWGVRLDATSEQPLPVSVNETQVFVTNLKTLFCLDRNTGMTVWQKQLEDLPSTGTIADQNFVVVGLRKGKFVAFSTRDRTKEKPPGRPEGTFLWAWQSNAPLNALPVLTPKVVAFGSEDSKVYVALKADTFTDSKLLYRFLAGGPIRARLGAFGNRTLIVPSDDFNVYGIDLFSGANRWTIATGAPIDRDPMIAGGDVFILNTRGRVLAIDGITGSVHWDQQTNARDLIAISPSRIYLSTLENRLIILDRATGQVLADARDTAQRAGFDHRNLTAIFPNHINDRIYLASPSGVVLCLREIGQLQPAPLRDPSRPPFGTIPTDGFTSDTEDPPQSATADKAPGDDAPDDAAADTTAPE